jgi:hypothetical protein
LKLFLEALHHTIHNAGAEIGGNEGRFEFLQEGRICGTAEEPIEGPANNAAGFGKPVTQSLQPSHNSTRDVFDSLAGWSLRQPRDRSLYHSFTPMHPTRFFLTSFMIVPAEMQNAVDQ